MCVPIDDDENASPSGWTRADRPARLGLVCDEYGLDKEGRARLLDCLAESIARSGQFVRRRVEAGEAAFIEMWEAMGVRSVSTDAADGGRKRSLTSNLPCNDLKVGETTHNSAPSISGCQAERTSRGITRSAHKSMSSAPSTKRSMSGGIPSRQHDLIDSRPLATIPQCEHHSRCDQ